MKVRLALAVALLVAFVPSAHAGQVTFGSDLSGAADRRLADEHQADVLFFNAPGQTNQHVSPVDGEVVGVRVKGTINSVQGRETNNLFHIQTLRPVGADQYTVTSSTQHLFFPVDVDPSTVSTFRASLPQCVAAGDVVNFNNVGGWDGNNNDPRGTIYQIFAAKPAHNVFWYEKDAGTMLNDTFTINRQIQNGREVTGGQHPNPGQPYPDREVLMQVDVATGYDAAVNCPGGRKGQEYKGVDITTPDPIPLVRDDGVARVRVTCNPGSYDSCSGSVKLEAEGVLLGTSDTFKLPITGATNVLVKLSNDAAGLLAQRGTLSAMATAATRDGHGVDRTDAASVTLKSARPVGPAGFAGTTAKAQSVTYKKGKKVTMKATCPAGTTGLCTGTLSAESRKKIGKKKVKMATAKYSIAPGKTAKFTLKLTSAGIKALKKAKKIDTTAVLRAKDGSGRVATTRVKLTFKQGR
jgi:hypothetical protein